MKKILILVLFVVMLVLTGCENPSEEKKQEPFIKGIETEEILVEEILIEERR